MFTFALIYFSYLTFAMKGLHNFRQESLQNVRLEDINLNFLVGRIG